MTKTVLLFVLISFLCSCSAGSPAKYYVSSSAGNDANNGRTESTPWKTISKVNGRHFSPGDSVFFKKGDVWRETLSVSGSGNKATYIFFGSFGTGMNPIIMGSEPVTGWVSVDNNVWKSKNSFINPEEFHADIHFKEKDNSISWGNYVPGMLSLQKEHDWYWNDNYIYIWSASDPASNYQSVEVPQRYSCIDTQYNEYIHFKGIDVFYAEYVGIDDFSRHSDNQNKTGLKIENCEIGYIGGISSSPSGFGIGVVYSDLVIRDCKIHHCGRRGISLDNYGYGFTARNALIEENIFYGGYHTTALDCNTGASGYSANWDGIVFRRNLVYEEEARQMPYSSNQVFVQRYGNTSLKNIYIYSNVFKFPGGAGISLEGVDSIFIYNNTFYDSHPSVKTCYQIFLDNYPTNIKIKNNIFYSLSTINSRGKCIGAGSFNPLEVEADFNLYYRIEQTLSILGLNNQYYMASRFPIPEGWETHGVKGDPLFLSGDDYRLQSKSPAAGKGVSLRTKDGAAIIEKDYNGNKYNDPPSIGAFEYVPSAR